MISPGYAIKSWNWKSKKITSKHRNLRSKPKSEPHRPLSTSRRTTKNRRKDWLKKPKLKLKIVRYKSIWPRHKGTNTFRS